MARRAKQAALPGVEPHRIPALTRLAKDYCSARDERMAAGVVEVELKDKLIGMMKEHKLESYVSNDTTIVLTAGKDNIKVKSAREDAEDPDEKGE